MVTLPRSLGLRTTMHVLAFQRGGALPNTPEHADGAAPPLKSLIIGEKRQPRKMSAVDPTPTPAAPRTQTDGGAFIWRSSPTINRPRACLTSKLSQTSEWALRRGSPGTLDAGWRGDFNANANLRRGPRVRFIHLRTELDPARDAQTMGLVVLHSFVIASRARCACRADWV